METGESGASGVDASDEDRGVTGSVTALLQTPAMADGSVWALVSRSNDAEVAWDGVKGKVSQHDEQ